jgi:molecular chaperone IbpA
MRFDLAPLYRSTVGFDRLASLLDQASGLDTDAPAYPPYNIERLTDNAYRITMAVAGFAKSDVTIEVRDSTLTVRGEKKPDSADRAFLHRGIAGRGFERRFQIADHVEVVAADLQDGLLHIELKRELPEKMKPRRIEIGTARTAAAGVASPTSAPVIEGTVAASK